MVMLSPWQHIGALIDLFFYVYGNDDFACNDTLGICLPKIRIWGKVNKFGYYRDTLRIFGCCCCYEEQGIGGKMQIFQFLLWLMKL